MLHLLNRLDWLIVVQRSCAVIHIRYRPLMMRILKGWILFGHHLSSMLLYHLSLLDIGCFLLIHLGRLVEIHSVCDRSSFLPFVFRFHLELSVFEGALERILPFNCFLVVSVLGVVIRIHVFALYAGSWAYGVGVIVHREGAFGVCEDGGLPFLLRVAHI